MQDAETGPGYGRTNWRRFAIAIGIPVAVAAGLTAGVANGAFAASFTVSGQPFKISADRLEGTGFAQYGSAVESTKTQIPVAMSGIKKAKLYNLCQSVRVADALSLTITAGTDADHPAEATDLLIGVQDLGGDATFRNINIGSDASTLSRGGAAAKGQAGMFGQEADSVVIDGLRQTALSTTAGTFTLTGLHLKLNMGKNPKECF